MNRPPIEDSTITVVMPLLNEVAVIRRVVDQVTRTLAEKQCQWNVVLVNDGSTDGSDVVLNEMAAADSRISVLHLSRNFGHQAAVHAGLSHCKGDAVVLMDSDAQDDPGAIAEMIDRWQDGYDVVYAVRFGRKESLPKRIAFASFHRLMASMAAVEIPRDAGNFGLMDARVVKEVTALGETDRYFPGLRTWVGFKQCALPVERLRRHDDQPRVSIKGLISLAKTAMFSFSRLPLLAFYGIAGLSAFIGCACIAWATYHKLVTGHAVPGWASITSLSAFFGAFNALGIAILGEYVARIYDQVRNRPAYIINETRNTGRQQDSTKQEADEVVLSELQLLRNELLEIKRSEPSRERAMK